MAHTDDQDILAHMKEDLLRFQEARRLAEELVLDRGWTKQDDDFEIQVDEEAKKQWEELYDREVWRLREEVENE